MCKSRDEEYKFNIPYNPKYDTKRNNIDLFSQKIEDNDIFMSNKNVKNNVKSDVKCAKKDKNCAKNKPITIVRDNVTK